MSVTDDNFARSWMAGEGWFIPASSLTELSAKSLNELIDRAKHGGSADIILRVDGVETRWQADWIKYTRKAPAPPLLSQEEAFQRAVKAGIFNGLVSKPEDTTL